MRNGLGQIGLKATISAERERQSDVAILLGTTLWRQIEASGRYLLVDRCSFGDTKHWVSLVWNGHGRRGDHKVPNGVGGRWSRVGVPIESWQTGRKTIVCGQTETYSPHYPALDAWYRVTVPHATHFRPHPAGMNPTDLPVAKTFDDCRQAVTLNSSVAVQAVLAGVPTVTMDEAAMAWPVTSHTPGEPYTPDRRPWAEWLAWTQWHHDEIDAGTPIRHLFEDI